MRFTIRPGPVRARHGCPPDSADAAIERLLPMALDDASPAVGVTAAPGNAQPAVGSTSADAIVGRLFDISIILASCAHTADNHAATRVIEAIDGLDHVIADLRTAIFDGFGNPELVGIPPRQNRQ